MVGKVIFLYMVAVCVAAPFDPSGSYGSNQHYGDNYQVHAIEQKLNDMEARESIMEGRQSAMTNAIKQELNKLELDSKTLKSVVNTIAEDSVKIHGDINLLKGHSVAMINLGRKMMKLEETINGIQRRLSE